MWLKLLENSKVCSPLTLELLWYISVVNPRILLCGLSTAKVKVWRETSGQRHSNLPIAVSGSLQMWMSKLQLAELNQLLFQMFSVDTISSVRVYGVENVIWKEMLGMWKQWHNSATTSDNRNGILSSDLLGLIVTIHWISDVLENLFHLEHVVLFNGKKLN